MVIGGVNRQVNVQITIMLKNHYGKYTEGYQHFPYITNCLS